MIPKPAYWTGCKTSPTIKNAHNGIKTFSNWNKAATTDVSVLFNAAKLEFGNKTTVENFFRNVMNPKVVVNDTANLIGA